MTDNARYVCAFRGARDRYQAAVALAETGELETLITDAYATPGARAVAAVLPASVSRALIGRAADGVPAERVRCLWGTTIYEHLRHRLGYSPRATWLKLDGRFGEAAAQEARRTRAHLLIYSPYAWEAFTAAFAHHPRRVLFQYHPHPDLEARILADDSKRFPGYGESFAAHDDSVDDALIDRERESWRHADAVICSSAFTRRSLVEAGCDARICHVVPYGVFAASPTAAGVPSAGFHALFVGSGGQRKGLHHLLLAWAAARPRQDWRLTIVSRVIDRGVLELASRTPNVEIVAGAAQHDLDARFASSTLFVMPSLVEGFGHVYLEALARGCPVLGTANTALPELGSEADGIFLVEPGQVDQLAARLIELGQQLPGNARIRGAARATADRFPWSAFRSRLRSALHE